MHQIMAPDKQWMKLIHDRLDDAYILGVENFLDYAFTRLKETREIHCPCIKCCNVISGTRELVKSHLIVHGIIQNYTFWYHHGERLGEPSSDFEFVDDNNDEEDDGEDEIHEILRDLYPAFDGDNMNNDGDGLFAEEPNLEAKGFYRILKDFEQPLYQDSNISKLSTLVKLLHIKSIGNWSNTSFIMLLNMLKEDLLPDGSNLPDSYYEAKKDKFDSDDINDQRDHVLKHMRKLWNNWRGSLHKNIKSKPFRDALKDVPNRIDKSDWEWLVKEQFLSDNFKEKSPKNSVNSSKLSMPHRTGSKPIRDHL
nr:uncharacterized protein LOC104104714 [Nicotiana tomentosiformis]XP_033514205.1 uncharacterized protein LOC104104714 [Nicotiana tomentosiformis]XP_033514206.1 uncharacterized protein LOC104104714 [Nicotiana tomentosiformis]